jgi:hypothetical protein
MIMKLALSAALVAGSLLSFGVAGHAMGNQGLSNLSNLPVIKTGLICGRGMHVSGLVCVPNRPPVARRVCPVGWHWGPAVKRCVR